MNHQNHRSHSIDRAIATATAAIAEKPTPNDSLDGWQLLATVANAKIGQGIGLLEVSKHIVYAPKSLSQKGADQPQNDEGNDRGEPGQWRSKADRRDRRLKQGL
jgi:hypothetical protein